LFKPPTTTTTHHPTPHHHTTITTYRCAAPGTKHQSLGEAVRLTPALIRLKLQHGDAIQCVVGGLASAHGSAGKKKKKHFWEQGPTKIERCVAPFPSHHGPCHPAAVNSAATQCKQLFGMLFSL
jgi:hypothetical protein